MNNRPNITALPRDLILRVGLFAGVPAMAALAATNKRFKECYEGSDYNVKRNEAVLTEAAKLGHMFSRHRNQAALALLAQAKQHGKHVEILTTPTTITHSPTITLHDITVVQYLLWSLNQRMFEKITKFLGTKAIQEQIRTHHQGHVPTAINAAWEALLTFANTMDKKAFTPGCDADTHCQKHFQDVITAMQDFPMHMMADLINPNRRIIENGKTRDFSDVTVPELHTLTDGTAINTLKMDTQFGRDHMFLCKLKSRPAERANVADAARYAMTKLRGDDNQLYDLLKINANAFQQVIKERLNWYENMLTATMQSELVEPTVSDLRASLG